MLCTINKRKVNYADAISIHVYIPNYCIIIIIVI